MHMLLNQGCYDESRWQKGERPGQYKKKYYGVGESAGVLPEDILITAAYFHCNFESIHPFADGIGVI